MNVSGDNENMKKAGDEYSGNFQFVSCDTVRTVYIVKPQVKERSQNKGVSVRQKTQNLEEDGDQCRAGNFQFVSCDVDDMCHTDSSQDSNLSIDAEDNVEDDDPLSCYKPENHDINSNNVPYNSEYKEIPGSEQTVTSVTNIWIKEKHSIHDDEALKLTEEFKKSGLCSQDYMHNSFCLQHDHAYSRNAWEICTKEQCSCGVCHTFENCESSRGFVTGLKCDLCKRFYSTFNLLMKHKSKYHVSQLYKCSVCGKLFKTLHCFKNHILIHKKKTNTLSLSDMLKHKSDDHDSKLHECNLCGKFFKALSFLEKHRLTHKEKTNTLPQSDIEKSSEVVILKTDSSAEEFIKLFHCYDKKYVCDVCSKVFSRSCVLEQHKLSHDTVKKQFFCNVCNKGFLHWSPFERHRVTHINTIERYQCKVCSEVFTSLFQVESHKSVHKDIKYLCSMCDKTFKTPTTLMNHTMNIHKHYSCDVCNKSFDTFRKMKQHKVVVHTNVKQYECKECGKVFQHIITLYGHMGVHSCITKYQCTICKAQFTNSSLLARHMPVCKVLYL